MDRLKFSIIGCQHEHISIFIQEMLDLGHECVGIYEKENQSLAQKLGDRLDVPVIEDRDMLLTNEIDLVGSSAINNEKIDIVELCEKYGKHIMLDKPAVTNDEGYQRLEQVIQRGKIKIGMLLTERYRPAFYTLKDQIVQGKLGDIVNISIRKPHKLSPSTRPKWHFSKEQCGGLVIDLFVHDFDLLRWLTGKEIERTSGLVAKNILPEYPTFYDTATLQVMLEGYTLVQLYADWHTPESSLTYGDGRVFVVGTKGYAELKLTGDPTSVGESIMMQMTHEDPPEQVDLQTITSTITEDFLNQIHDNSGSITHDDILATSRATLDADGKVEKVSIF
ncbi:Gfo/Idh/MocA family protein [Alteribacter populi]|uniref:Gfo/Idh/MocA family protein n=1 Tax=Alteribacter populi TaxID=2011011 RepID=UPI000BBA73EE|nr:Gfo/Idh/MocA family oxidoreductase [Alteribacter populi]